MNIPYAVHSSGFKKLDDNGYMCVLRPDISDEEEEELSNELVKEASKCLGRPACFAGGSAAGDFFHGTVFLLFFKAYDQCDDDGDEE